MQRTCPHDRSSRLACRMRQCDHDFVTKCNSRRETIARRANTVRCRRAANCGTARIMKRNMRATLSHHDLPSRRGHRIAPEPGPAGPPQPAECGGTPASLLGGIRTAQRRSSQLPRPEPVSERIPAAAISTPMPGAPSATVKHDRPRPVAERARRSRVARQRGRDLPPAGAPKHRHLPAATAPPAWRPASSRTAQPGLRLPP